MRVALLSDTHVPARADAIPGSFRERIESADHVVHAGDFETPEVLATVRELATDLTAVHGNADPHDVGLPAVDSATVDGVTVVVTHGMTNHLQAAVHDHGSVMTREDWVGAVADTARARTREWTGDDAVVGVAGHTHEVLDEVHGGFRLLNPGTATGAAPADRATMMTLDTDPGPDADGRVAVTVHEAGDGA